MKWFEIPETLIPKLKELQDRDINYEIVKSEDAIVMFYGLGDPLYLTFDGRVIIEDMLGNIPVREATTFTEAVTAIVVGAKIRKFPELLSILPERAQNSSDCEICNGTGWLQVNENLGPFVCSDCGGLGWKIEE